MDTPPHSPAFAPRPVWRRLYVRIWLAVVLAVAVLTLLVGWAWRLTAEPPLREMVVRDSAGRIVGQGRMHLRRPLVSAATGVEPKLADAQGSDADTDADEPPSAHADQGPNARLGPEFLLRMNDGQTFSVQLPRPRREPRSPWSRWPFGFAWSLVLVGVAVALATYPILRKLTLRLELLRQGVERWGAGDLSVRVPVRGQDEVASLAHRFNQAAQRIESLVDSHTALLARQDTLLQAQKSLLANASHELRSPLARIRMGLELLGDDTAPRLRAELSRNIAELDALIEEILLASRLDAKEADVGTVEAVDLLGLAAEECARVDAQLVASGHLEGASPEFVVQGVAKLLRRLLRNLLENARRHGAGEVICSLQRKQGKLVVAVCDSGPGVPVELRDRIFEPFYRLPGASEGAGGVGLGLALVKSIAERHHATVHCEDHAGGGACFVVELALVNPEPSAVTI